MATNPDLKCPQCQRLAANHSKPHCSKQLCGWMVCQKCKRVYEIPK